MTRNELEVVGRIIDHATALQRELTAIKTGKAPSNEDATDEELVNVLKMFWTWQAGAALPFPRKHVLEKLVGIMRGCTEGYAYVSGAQVARILRQEFEKDLPDRKLRGLKLRRGYQDMTDKDLYYEGRCNYRMSPIVQSVLEAYKKASYDTH